MTDLDALWVRHKRAGNQGTRDDLIREYLPLVRAVARRLASGLPQSVEQADLESYGVFGLLDAIDKFDLERGYRFETYAMARIKGAILDELRSIDWAPRSVRARARIMERAQAKLEAELHRSPTGAEMAAELAISPEEFRAHLADASAVTLVALDPVPDGESASPGDAVPASGEEPTAGYYLESVRGLLADAIGEMAERETIILALYYLADLTLANIGLVLGVTESRVCQIHTNAMLALHSGCLADGLRPCTPPPARPSAARG